VRTARYTGRSRPRRLEVATVRYDAGRFGRGYKSRPQSTAGIRSIPLAALVVEELRRRRPAERSSLLFPHASRYLRALRRARVHGHLLGLDLRGPHDLRHTTTAMEVRVLQVPDTRLAEAVAVVESSG
jgi:integrase